MDMPSRHEHAGPAHHGHQDHEATAKGREALAQLSFAWLALPLLVTLVLPLLQGAKWGGTAARPTAGTGVRIKKARARRDPSPVVTRLSDAKRLPSRTYKP